MSAFRLSALAFGLLSAAHAHAESTLIAKQLAGPPSEFAAMQPQDPAAAAIHSNAALLAVEMSAGKTGAASWRARATGRINTAALTTRASATISA